MSRLHLWYSPKASCACQGSKVFYRLSSGKVVEVTEAVPDSYPLSTWDDLEYLGTGTFDHIEGPVT